MQLERPRPRNGDEGSSSRSRLQALGPAPLAPDFSQYRALYEATNLDGEVGRVAESADGAQRARQRQDSGQTAQEELLSSLSVAEHTFVEALHHLLKRNFSLATPSTAPNGFGSSSKVTGETDDEAALRPLLEDLRTACRDVDVSAHFHENGMRQVIPTQAQGGALEEIRARVEHLSPYMSISLSTNLEDAQVAKNLASTLSCIRRLEVLYRSSTILANSHSLRTPLATPRDEMPPSPSYSFFPPMDQHAAAQAESSATSSEIYSTLHRQAKVLQSSHMSKQNSQDSTVAVRAVEEAEVELLWGRVDDLLESISAAYKPAQPESTSYNRTTRTGVDQQLLGPTPAMASEDATFGAQHLLPEYESHEPPEYAFADGNRRYSEDRKDSLDLEERPQRRTSTRNNATRVPDEKMQVDLDRMTSAIERLYFASPQLANQRVDTVRPTPEDRQAMREAQLTKLGTAIERLSKGRLEGQRATLGESSATSSTRSLKGKQQESKQESLEKLLDNIDKAASRTMNDQRVSVSAKQEAVLRGARETAQAASTGLRPVDNEELAFREQLLASVGKGRLTGQDAKFTLAQQQQHMSAPPGSTNFNGAFKRRSMAHIIDEDNSSSASSSSLRARSSSVGAYPPLLPANPSATNNSAQLPDKVVKKRFSVSRLLNKEKDTTLLSAPTGRRQSRSQPVSRAGSATGDAPLQLRYIVEEMRNLGSMTLRSWDERFEQEILPSSLSQEAWSLTYVTATAVRLHTDSATHDTAYLRLAADAPVSSHPDRPLDAVFKTDHFEIRLPTAEASQTTRARDDLDIFVPYTAKDFLSYRPETLVCVSCGSTLAEMQNVTRFNDLPSEHWAELLDAWMCHHDQTLSEELIAKGNNIWPKGHQALISSNGIILAAENTTSWVVADDLEPTNAPDGKWQPIRCSSCRAVVGRSSPGPAQELQAETAYIRFSKLAVQPVPSSKMPIHSLSSHITSALLETSLSRAIHRFVVEDEEQGTARLVLWVFNPFIRLFSNNISFPGTAPLKACKILYHAGGDLDETIITSLLGSAEYETVIYPSRVCSQLGDLLEASTAIYPRSQRRLGEWTVGWLERK